MVRIKLNSRVKASTMLEVIIAMVVILVVFVIGMMIFTNVLKLSLSTKKIRAQALLGGFMLNAERAGANSNQLFTVDGFRIQQEASPYKNDSDLTTIQLTAYDQNQQKVAELKKIIIVQP